VEKSKSVILIVDDQKTAIHVMQRMLQDEYIVLTANGGELGLEAAREKQPDLILLDMVMPGLSGIEVCQQLVADPLTQKIPIIFVTSMDDSHNEAGGLKAGAIDYIFKPPAPGVVLARVKIHLQQYRLTRFVESLASGDLSDIEAIQTQAKRLLSPSNV
jgi:putative two-component system response regulator